MPTLEIDLDDSTMQYALTYANEHNQTVSEVLKDILVSLKNKESMDEADWYENLHPKVKELIGVLPLSSKDIGDYKEYMRNNRMGYLNEKYSN